MKAERTILVTDRVPGSDLGEWMHVMETSMSYDHRANNALCQATKMEYAKIPLAHEDAEVGVPRVNN